MPLIKSKSQKDIDLEQVNSGVYRAAEALHQAIKVMQEEYDMLWALPTERLLDVLNDNLTYTLETFAANTTAANFLNSIMESSGEPSFSLRAPTAPGRTDITFDGTKFVYVAPPNPIPEP